MCAGNGHLLRVGPFTIARRYSYWIAYQTDPAPVIVAVYFETANIPGRL